MDDLQSYSPEEVIVSNLRETDRWEVEAGEQAYAHLCELAAEIAAGFSDAPAFLSSLPEHRPPTPPLTGGLRTVTAALRPMLRELTARNSILLCIELGRRIPTPRSLWLDFFFPGGDEEPNRSSFNRISCQKNRYTDAAYERFATLLPEPRAAFAHSYRSVCEDVYNGLCEYCILPLENSTEGRLTSFSRLIAMYDMKIAAVCDVPVGDDRVTRFALLRRTPVMLRAPDAMPWYFEFSCTLPAPARPAPGGQDDPPAHEPPGAPDVLSAARFCGLTLGGADVSRGPEGSTRLHALLRVDQGNLPAFLLYLAMELPGAVPIGLYPNLSER